MNLERIYSDIKKDKEFSNYINQAWSKYFLLLTNELDKNSPKYTISNEKISLLAFLYLDVGCNYLENEKDESKGREFLNQGASLIDQTFSPIDHTDIMKYSLLIGSLSYFISCQYSKAYITMNKIKDLSPISNLVFLFIKKDFKKLKDETGKIFAGENYFEEEKETDSKHEYYIEEKIYLESIAKIFNAVINYYLSGDNNFLYRAKETTEILLELSRIEKKDEMWWIMRLLLLLIKVVECNSLWNGIEKMFSPMSNEYQIFINKYIRTLYFQKIPVTELFLGQREAIKKYLENQQGCVISMPTSSGKTRVAEIAILHTYLKNKDNKVIYIAPFKSLCFEIENSFEKNFRNLGIEISHLYGGHLFSSNEKSFFEISNIVIATPEKIKALIRYDKTILENVKLVIFDEGHLIGGENDRDQKTELFLEELKYLFTKIHEIDIRFLFMSAVLANPDVLSKWLFDSEKLFVQNKQTVAEKRQGLIVYQDYTKEKVAVNLEWYNHFTREKGKAYNRNFIERIDIPLEKGKRKKRFFPSNENQTVVAVAHKLRKNGGVLIFAGRKDSVFTIAEEYSTYLKLKQEPQFIFKDKKLWSAFKDTCSDIINSNSKEDWVKYASEGIFCHSANLFGNARILMEKLMISENPRVIIATSTLGQGVNLRVSSIIFRTIKQGKDPLTYNQFWNIAGRAGRAFVDTEGKILIFSQKDSMSKEKAWNYFKTGELEPVVSFWDSTIASFERVSRKNNIEFQTLLNFIAEGKSTPIDDVNNEIHKYLELTGDTLLALFDNNNQDKDEIEEIIHGLLIYAQKKHLDDCEEYINKLSDLLKATKKRLVIITDNNKGKWNLLTKTGLTISNANYIYKKTEDFIILLNEYNNSDKKLELLEKIEYLIKDMSLLTNDNNFDSIEFREVERKWISGETVKLDKYRDYFEYKFPWILNGIAQLLYQSDKDSEANLLRELGQMVNLGLPDLNAVLVYLSGIGSRKSAIEIANKLDNGVFTPETTKNDVRKEILRLFKSKNFDVSDSAKVWCELLDNNAKNIKKERVHVASDILEYLNKAEINKGDSSKNDIEQMHLYFINNKLFLISIDLSVKIDVTNLIKLEEKYISDIYFRYNQSDKKWYIKSFNPNTEFFPLYNK